MIVRPVSFGEFGVHKVIEPNKAEVIFKGSMDECWTFIEYFDKELQDDDTECGGVAFRGETLEDFIEDTVYNSLDELNEDLVACGIRPIRRNEL